MVPHVDASGGEAMELVAVPAQESQVKTRAYFSQVCLEILEHLLEFLPKHQQALARVQLPCHLNHAICLFQQLGDPGARRLADAKAHCDDAIKLKEFGDEFAQPK